MLHFFLLASLAYYLQPPFLNLRNYLLRGLSYTAVKSPWAVMQNFATFEWLLWQQELIGGKFK